MRRDDARAKKVAIVADILINPHAAFYEEIAARPGPVADVLVDDGWGIMKAPPHLLRDEAMASALATIAGDASDYAKHAHAVVILAARGIAEGGLRLGLLARAFRDLRAAHPPIVWIDVAEDCAAAAIRDKLAAAVPQQTAAA